ncbi:MAG TPA: AAA family ATPase [Acidimicrobiales bacterium]
MAIQGVIAPERFVGRTHELRRLTAACAAAERGLGSLTVVSGVAGIGKTRLCSELAQRAERAGLRVVIARCWADGGAPPLWPWHSIVRDIGGVGSVDLLASDAGGVGIDPDRFARFVAVTDLLADACAKTPTCLIIEDLHAADPGSLLLTRFVARSLDRLPLALVLSRRSGEPTPGGTADELLTEIASEAGSVVLHGFSRNETTRFLAGHGLRRLDSDLVSTLLGVTEGNPLFLRRVAALGPPDAGQAWPTGVRVAIEQASKQLSADAQRVLRLSAVLGIAPSLAEVVAVTGTAPAQVVEAVREAGAAGLVTTQSPDGFTFTHDLVRSALDDSLDVADRWDAHARAARVVAGDRPELAADRLARRAHHALAAASRSADDARFAVSACRDAARSMIRRFAYEQAESLLTAAVDLCEPSQIGPPSPQLLVEWAQATLLCGRVARARRRFERAVMVADEDGDPVTFAEAAAGLGGHWVIEHRELFDRTRVLGLQRAALERLPPDQHGLRCRLQARLAAEAVFDGGPVAAVEEALAAARSCGDSLAHAEALSLSHHALMDAEHTWSRLELAEELIRVASEGGHGVLSLMGLCWRAVDLLYLGDPRALQALEVVRERADALACRTIQYVVAVIDVVLLIRQGRLAEAEADALRVYEMGEAEGEVDTWNVLCGHMLEIRWIQGRETELADTAEQLAISPNLPRNEFALRAAATLIEARSGQASRARASLDSLAERGLAALPLSATWLTGMMAIVEVAVQLGDEKVAREAYDLLLPYADLPVLTAVAILCFGSTERTLGVAALTFGDVDRAIEHLDRAVVANRRLGHRPLAVMSQGALATALGRRGQPRDRARAAALLDQAIAEAESMDLPVRAEGWRAELAALHGGARSGDVPGQEDALLSQREREIAGLLADGLGNGQIAEQLFISKRTVESHLDNIKRKLCLASRHQIVAWALRRGLGSRSESV